MKRTTTLPTTTSGTVRKTTLALTPEATAMLRELAKSRNVSFAEVVRRALNVEKFLQEARENGGRVVVEEPGKPARELVIL